MTDYDKKICGNCVWYSDNSREECHRHAPTSPLTTNIHIQNHGIPPASWPRVSNGNWCGDFETKWLDEKKRLADKAE